MKKYTIHNGLGGEVGFVEMMDDHQHDPLIAYGQKVGLSSEEVKALNYTAKPWQDPLDNMEPWQREIILRGEMNERLYLRLEAVLNPPEPDEGMLERLNLCMGFPTTGPHAKDKDYRPYCGRCDRGPRMMRHKHGFMCWDCKNIWDLRLTCRHKNPDGTGRDCLWPELERMPIGHRCPRCAGMHHFTGRPKDEESVKTCKLNCCNGH